MKKIIFSIAIFLCYSFAYGNSQFDDKTNQSSIEDLKAEFEKLKDRPVSKDNFTWFAQCEKNSECKKMLLRHFDNIPHNELTKSHIALVLKYYDLAIELEEYTKNIAKQVEDQFNEKYKTLYENTLHDIQKNEYICKQKDFCFFTGMLLIATAASLLTGFDSEDNFVRIANFSVAAMWGISSFACGYTAWKMRHSK